MAVILLSKVTDERNNIVRSVGGRHNFNRVLKGSRSIVLLVALIEMLRRSLLFLLGCWLSLDNRSSVDDAMVPTTTNY